MAKRRYVADFETTGADQVKIDGETRVWAVCVMDIETEEVVLLSNDIYDFFKFIALHNHNNEKKVIYFHNLKFDGQFIIDYLLRSGYIHSTQRKLYTNEFSTLISDMGQFYQIKICLKNYGTWSLDVVIHDSFKKLPFSEKRIAEAFDLPTKKGEIDYKLYRGENWQITEEEKEYIINDCLIIAKALKIQFKRGMTKMTIGSDALYHYKNIISDEDYKFYFPVLPIEVDDTLRLSYRGGVVWVKPSVINKTLKNTVSLDRNSMYPAVMKEELLPYGEPVYYTGKYIEDKYNPLYIQVVRVIMKLKEGYMPTIQSLHSFRYLATNFIIDTDGEYVDLVLTNIDLDLMLKHYHIYDIQYLEGFKFRGAMGLFDEYIDYFYEMKAQAKNPSAERELAKLFLNNLYGKFGTNPRKRSMIPIIDEELDVLRYIKGEVNENVNDYVAMASFITAGARKNLITTAQKFYDNLAYVDTDSVKIYDVSLEDIKKIINVDGKELGAWKYEYTADRFKVLRPKTYISEYDNQIHVTCSGLPNDARKDIDFDNFTFGFSTNKKLTQKRVKGGVVLEETTFEIKEIKVKDTKRKNTMI